MNKKMLIKTLVALAMIAVVVPIAWIGGIPMQILLAVIGALGAYECAALFDTNKYIMAALGFAAVVGLYMAPASHLGAVIRGHCLMACRAVCH